MGEKNCKIFILIYYKRCDDILSKILGNTFYSIGGDNLHISLLFIYRVEDILISYKIFKMSKDEWENIIEIWNCAMISSGLKRKIRGLFLHWVYKTANTKKLQNTNTEGGEKK